MLARATLSLVLVSATVFIQQLPAQQPPAQQPPTPGRGAGRGAGRGPMVPPLEETGFKPIFDGRSMSGWDGDPKFWRVEDGALIGQTLTDKQPDQNTFLIWRGGSPADFELKLQFKLTGYNSGIQFRSIELPDIKWAMKGYQADMDGQQQYTGQIYEERGRGFLAMRGMFSYIGEGKKAAQVSSLGATGDELKSIIKSDDWNDLGLICRGNVIIQMLNGRVTSMLIDDDTAGRKMDGLLGIQVHKGPPMKIEVKNIRLKNL
jgi:Domain of Unknown Function (DUF1080)